MASANQTREEELIHGLMNDVVGADYTGSKDELADTISQILKQYNLSTELSFVERVATMKFDGKDEAISVDTLPKELEDAAFLPVTTIADIALRQDIDLVVSQIPEWFNALIVTRDAICEADTVDGKLARNIIFDRQKLTDTEEDKIVSCVEQFEEKLGLHKLIKNHMVFNTLMYGEGYVYAVPYAKVFNDLYKYRLKADEKSHGRGAVSSMFETSSALKGYGYSESSNVEISLADTVVQETTQEKGKKPKHTGVFTESEIMEIYPHYHEKTPEAYDETTRRTAAERDEMFDEWADYITHNIRYIEEDIALPVIEQSAHDLRAVYDTKYSGTEFVQETNRIFETVMSSTDPNNVGIEKEFKGVNGIYLKILPATKLIPIRIDRTIVGYYYISDLTRPEQTGERRNSGLSGYTLRSPSVGHDTFSPDRMFCEKLATKIINNFNLKFMRDNASLHDQIVAILEAHRFNESMMRFIYIPAEHVVQCTINEDGAGKGHSMLEGGLITARMYMFLKLYSILYQINNAQIRVYNIRQSGIDKNYKQFVQQTMRKFAARRVTANDIFNYRSSMTKVSGGSELIMPTGPDNQPPISVETIDAAKEPINTDLMDALRAETINSTPVPAIMVQNGGVTEIEFAKETELSNTRFASFISSTKIDMNPAITKLYRTIARWSTDIDPDIISSMKFAFKMPNAKTLNVTSEKLSNFENLKELVVKNFLTKKEQQDAEGNDDEISNIRRNVIKQLLMKYMPEVDVDELEALVNTARIEANKETLDQVSTSENIADEVPDEEMGG